MSRPGSISDRGLHRWRAPALSGRVREPGIDDAGWALRRLAQNVLAQVPRVIAGCTVASLGAVERRGYTDDPSVADRAWRFTHADREVFCVLDEVSERSLLGWIVGGATRARPSAIERNIIAEAARRLLTAPGDASPADFREEPRTRPSSLDWRCQLELVACATQHATLAFFTARVTAPPPALAYPPDLRDVTVSLRATLPSIGCALAELSAWRGGTLLHLRRPQRDFAVWLSAGGRRIATARLGTVLGERAAKLVAVNAGPDS
jgi:hypothetical protein